MAELLSLTEIFEKRIMRIPDYQRGFSWNDKQLNDFWDDLDKVSQSRIHYIGLLTIEKVKISAHNINKWNDTLFLIKLDEQQKFTPFYIVDGQQRITTAIILIASIIEKLNIDSQHSDIQKKSIIQKYIKIENENGKTFIFGYEKDDPSYQYLKTHIFKEQAANDLNEPKTVYTQNLSYAKDFFDKKINNYNSQQLDLLHTKLTQNFKFNLYEVDDDLDVYVMFETMNNRGKPLSKLELLKNRLIYLSTILDSKEEEIFILRNQINDSWKTIYSYLGRNKENLLNDDDFLKNHTYMYFGYKDTTADLFSEFLLDKHFTAKNVIDKHIRLSNIEDYVISIQKSVQKWFEINFPFHETSTLNESFKEWIDKIGRLKYPPFEPNIMAALLNNTQTDAMLKLLKSMDRYVFLVFKIFQSRTHMGKNLFYGKAKAVYETGDVWDLKRLIESRTDSDTKNYEIKLFQSRLNEILQNVKDKKGYFAWNGLHYFLYEYELFLQGKEEQKTSYNKFIKRNTIEHIYPQISTEVCWSINFDAFTNDEKIRLKNSLGNLLLLTAPKNSSLQNKCFDYKKRHQSKNNANEFEGYYNGSHSEIEVNACNHWTAKEILERGIKMLNFIETRWEIKFGNYEIKKKLLYLDFLKIGEHELNI